MTLAWAVLLAAHLGAASTLLVALVQRRRGSRTDPWEGWLLHRAPELLLALTLVPAAFAFIYAANANMDYVQRMASGGRLLMAADTAHERLAVTLRWGPLLAFDIGWFVVARVLRPMPAGERGRHASAAVATWALPLSLLSSVLFALSFPSFASSRGIASLAWICLIPLFVVLGVIGLPWGLFYGTVSYVFGSMLTNYWLATFHLVALQLQVAVAVAQVIPFLAVALLIARRAKAGGFLVLPMAWTVFDWVRSLGFLGYPWGIIGTTQYQATAIVQIASLGGVWAVSFLVLMVNGVAAWLVVGVVQRQRRTSAATLALFACFVGAYLWGQWRQLEIRRSDRDARSVQLVLVQQNADPRKSDYAESFGVLRQLTESELASAQGAVDLVVWSETAFVVNISRWSTLAPEEHPYAALTHGLLAWQKTLGTWLLTGNDDYELGPGGESDRRDYNAALLFAPDGTRVQTYRKMHLVPFTEYFPWKRELPGLYGLLQRFDVYLWEPGERRVVFAHPAFRFSTPICFEDSFPDDVRRFVADGAEIIVNLSNDYWSLTEVEAMQHAANSVLRAVENDRPLVRASASGLTCSVDRAGRIVARAPLYAQAALTVRVPVAAGRSTLYTRWGDWFPLALSALLVAALLEGIVRGKRGPRQR